LNKGKLIINENIIGFSAKKLLYERNKFTNFKNYVEAIIEEELLVKNVKKEKRENFSKYLKDKFQKEILQNVELSSDEEDSEEEEKKEKKFPKDLKDLKKNINKHFNGHFSYNEYKDYENKFNEYKGKNKDPQKNEIPQIILSSFEKKIKQIIDDFQNITQIKNFKKDIQQKLNISDEEIEKIEENKIKQYLEKIKENPKLIKDPFEALKKLGDLIQTLLLMKREKGVIKTIIDNYGSLKKYFEQERFLRIVAIGAYNSGKTSVFNTIILGKDILPVDVKECTKIGIILRHCDSEKDIGLFPVEIKKNEKNKIFYFDYDTSKNYATSYTEIKNKIFELNKKTDKNNFSYYLIRMPLKLFDYIQVEEKLKTKIEFIDFPGLNTDFQIAKDNCKDILSFTNGFIFIQGDKVTNENDNKTLLTDILDTISDKPWNFSFKSCIFLMNKCDLYNIDLKKKKSELEHFIYTIINKNTLSKRLENVDKEITSTKQINFTKFSCYNFELFKKDNEHINNTNIISIL